MKLHSVLTKWTRLGSIGENRCAVQRNGQMYKNVVCFFLCPDADYSRNNFIVYSTDFGFYTVFFDVSFHYKAVMQLNLFASLVFRLVCNPGEAVVEDGMVLEVVDS